MSKTRQKGAGRIIVCRVERCLACRSCEIACALAHAASEDLCEAVLEEPRPQRRVRVEAAGDRGLPLQCRHCEDAPCMAVCPSEAIHRASPEGPVLVDPERCIGCKFCLAVCPFGVIELARDGRAVVKCDLCVKRLEAGKQPACVAACPTAALKFVEIDDHLRRRRREAARLVAESRARTGEEAEV